MNSEDYLVYFKSKNIETFKIIFDIIQKLKQDTFIKFYRGTDTTPGGIEIKDMDTDSVIVFKLEIPQTNLDEFYCADPVYVIGLDFSILSKIIQIMSDSTELCFSILKCEDQKLYIKSYNNNHTQEMESSINLSINDYIDYPTADINYVASVLINTDSFHTTCKKHSKISNYITIISTQNYLELRSKDTDTTRATLQTKFFTSINSSAKNNIIIRYDENFLQENQIPIIEANYSIANIAHFDKLKSKASQLDIRIAAGHEPIAFVYDIPTFGRFTGFIAAIQSDD